MATENDRPWPERHFSECLPLITAGVVEQEYELEMTGGARLPVKFGMNPDIGVWLSIPIDGHLVEMLIVGPYKDEESDPLHDVILNVFVDEDDADITINLSEFVRPFPIFPPSKDDE